MRNICEDLISPLAKDGTMPRRTVTLRQRSSNHCETNSISSQIFVGWIQTILEGTQSVRRDVIWREDGSNLGPKYFCQEMDNFVCACRSMSCSKHCPGVWRTLLWTVSLVSVFEWKRENFASNQVYHTQHGARSVPVSCRCFVLFVCLFCRMELANEAQKPKEKYGSLCKTVFQNCLVLRMIGSSTSRCSFAWCSCRIKILLWTWSHTWDLHNKCSLVTSW